MRSARSCTASTRSDNLAMMPRAPSATPHASATRRISSNISERLVGSGSLPLAGLAKCRESRNSAVTDGTNVAQFLGENYIRLQLTQKQLIDSVNCAVIVQRPPHPLIDFPTRQASIVHWTMRDPWPRVYSFWEIAFMGNADDLVHQAKRGCDLGRSGQKRNDPGHFSFYALSPHQNRKGRIAQQRVRIISTTSPIVRRSDALQNAHRTRDQQDDDSE